jgi:hypothetical protein
MKRRKILHGTCIGLLVFMLFGCGSSPSPKAEAPSGEGKSLDAAIQEAAAQMEARLPAKTTLALVSVGSPSAAFSENVINRLESAIVSSGKLDVVDRANLDKIRAEEGFQLSGEVDDNSAKAIGVKLGAGAIVTGSLTDLGDVYSLTLKAINIETAMVAVSYLADLAKTTRIETMMASGGGAGSGRTAPSQTVGTSGGNTPAPVASAAPEPVQRNPDAPYKIGETGPAGGIVFYDKGGVSNGWRYLEAAPANAEFTAAWGVDRATINGTSTALGYGKRNTETIVKYLQSKEEIGKAAEVCVELFAGGYNDWFLPSKDELNMMYTNLKEKRLGGFGNGYYWSSSETDTNYAWIQDFSNGDQWGEHYYLQSINDHISKKYANNIRAIRQF